ncbi:cytochrome bd oxidase small subunit, CydX/CbdX family [Gilliamella sp. Choc6-1]|jgi:predicted outer membrane lipoprotein|nr:cytochrome bd oxidase small subunit, CydX/CbdX family [Gilliamella apicola]
MYYILWFIGLIAACMISVVSGLWIERISSEKETNNK